MRSKEAERGDNAQTGARTLGAPRRISGNAPSPTKSRQAERPGQDIAELYRARAPKLVASLRKMFGAGPPDPEDVAQQAFEKLLERGDCSDIAALDAFLWRSARNLMLKGKRHEDVRAKYDFEIEQLFFPRRGDTSTPEGVLRTKEELAAINQALREMPEKRRRAFILHRVDGLPVVEVAKRLGIARSPANRHISRAYRDIELRLGRAHRESKS